MNIDFSAATEAVNEMLSGAAGRTPYVLVAIVVFSTFYFAGRIVRTLVLRFAERTRRRRNLGLVLGRLSHAGVVFLGVLVAMVIALPGFTPGELIGVLGISSVAVGFAFRDILQNFLAGILLLLAEPFRIGDQIKSGDFEGTVEDIQTRATFMRTYDGRRIVIPNSTLFVNSVTVNTAFDKRRLEYDFTIKPGEDIDAMKQLLVNALYDVPHVLRDPPPDAIVVDWSNAGIKIRVRWWISPPSQYELRNGLDAALVQIDAVLAEERERRARAEAARKQREESDRQPRSGETAKAHR